MKKLTNDEVILNLKNLYGNKFIYSKVNYINSRSRIILVCPKHGDIDILANEALRDKAHCKFCEKRLDKDTFEFLSKQKYKDKFDYSLVTYINRTTPVSLICPEHGEIQISPLTHLQSTCGCLQCNKEARTLPKKEIISKETQAINRTKEWVEKCSSIWNNKYDYSLVPALYTLNTKVLIKCPIHGTFEQLAYSHLKHGCQKCARIENSKKTLNDANEIISQFNKVHSNKYTYGEYLGMHNYMNITCSKHGVFKQTPSNHLKGYGCPKCAASLGETVIMETLDLLKVPYKYQYTITTRDRIKNSNYLIADFLVNFNNKSYIIEYNGIQHYKYIPYLHKGGEIDFQKLLFRDNYLRTYCKEHNLILIEFKYSQTLDEVKSILKEIFNDKIP